MKILQSKYESILKAKELLKTKLRQKQKYIRCYNLKKKFSLNKLRDRLYELMLKIERIKLRMEIIEELTNPFVREWSFVGSQYSES